MCQAWRHLFSPVYTRPCAHIPTTKHCTYIGTHPAVLAPTPARAHLATYTCAKIMREGVGGSDWLNAAVVSTRWPYICWGEISTHRVKPTCGKPPHPPVHPGCGRSLINSIYSWCHKCILNTQCSILPHTGYVLCETLFKFWNYTAYHVVKKFVLFMTHENSTLHIHACKCYNML